MRQALYRAALRLLPPGKQVISSLATPLEAGQEAALCRILRRHRARSAEVRLFEQEGRASLLLYQGPGAPLRPDTCFRMASLSKMVTALAALKLWEAGRLDIDGDLSPMLGYPLRHPGAPEVPLTLRLLMSHRAGICDGKAYEEGLLLGTPAPKILGGDSFLQTLPGEAWHYSNFGAGLVACAMEGALGASFEAIMQETVFLPLGIRASFYPQLLQGPLAEAWRILPPRRRPNFDPDERRRRPLSDADVPRPQLHYALAQGNCCMGSRDLQALLSALMAPGFLKEATLQMMQGPLADIGARPTHLKQCLGIFRLDEPAVCGKPLFGHQGNAYGAVHAAFFEPGSGRGLIFLSTGVSEARGAFLCDVVEELLTWGFTGDPWQGT
ncbi:MAG: serine hydrolase domain-containing protein [Christensenellales bacterium]